MGFSKSFNGLRRFLLIISFITSLGFGQTKIATIGNSITQGSGLSNAGTQSYSALMGGKLGDNVDVSNYGLSGRTLLKKGDNTYWDEAKFQQLFTYQPDIITIMLGTNDTKPQNWQFSSEFKSDLEAMIDTLSGMASKPQIILVLPPGVTRDNFGIRASVMQNEVIPIIKQVAQERSLGLIDVNTPTLNQAALMPDGVHPLVEGHQLMADVFNEGIQNLALNRSPQQRLLWYGDAPGANGSTQADKPDLFLYPAHDSNNTGIAVLVCPGGGYGNLAMGHEGHDVANWYNQNGISAFILRYRFSPYRHPIPLSDVSRAMRIVRQLAATYNIDSTKIGVMGFSAGGHLASTLLTHYDMGDAQNLDPIEQYKSKPDFGVLIYPVITLSGPYAHNGSRNNLLGSNPSQNLIDSLSNHLQVTAQTPTTFLASGDNDNAVPIQNSQMFDSALTANGISSKLVVDPGKAHGYGLDGIYPDSLLLWLRQSGFVSVSSFDQNVLPENNVQKLIGAYIKDGLTSETHIMFLHLNSSSHEELKNRMYDVMGRGYPNSTLSIKRTSP